jgi:hypothetical protein
MPGSTAGRLMREGRKEMSYDLGLYKDGQAVEVQKHEEGGTYVVGGTSRAAINITYNYGWFFYRCLDKEKGLRWLYGKAAQETIERLESAIEELGTRQYKDYWAPTPGNAGHALNVLLEWAKQHPDAVWDGD